MKGKKDKSSENKLKKALMKKALGYDTEEIVEEYVGEDEGVKLLKRKVTKKNYPPDVSAIKLLMVEEQTPLEQMTDVELEQEKNRLLKILKATEEE
jgi:hypothetical protein